MPVFYFFGDSITASGRLWQQTNGGLGDGYVSLLAAQLKNHFSEISFYNKGFDGFTAAALLRCLRQDTVWQAADYITVQIGINNVGVAMNTGVSLQAQDFSMQYRHLLCEIASRTSARILALGPFIFPQPQEYAAWLPTVREAEAIMAKAAADLNISFVPLQNILNDAAHELGYCAVTTDGIHLTGVGHRILAACLLPYYTCDM
ncbi:MAG: SGNH/GDSL hydrolase family protein [Marvinbryantia sp.]|uniref:SGNH/GDSL hydrolase family protein n=1 Tax=Marvinbryantia sp. TaxID=2496532 RepID=UPI0025EB9C1D|nr:GDSL-type esterase/lipase family protein [uncultured Marvinbryantia sp.]